MPTEVRIPVTLVNHFGHRAQIVAVYDADQPRKAGRTALSEYRFMHFELIEQKRRGRKPGRKRGRKRGRRKAAEKKT